MQKSIAHVLNLAITLEAMFITVLGLHALFAHFCNIDIVYGSKKPEDLFLTIDVPNFMEPLTRWVTIQAFDSLAVPICLMVASISFFYLRSQLSTP